MRVKEYYIMPSNSSHRKQRGRTAPNRALSAVAEGRVEIYNVDKPSVSIMNQIEWIPAADCRVNRRPKYEEIVLTCVKIGGEYIPDVGEYKCGYWYIPGTEETLVVDYWARINFPRD